jgi:hypothetical protein
MESHKSQIPEMGVLPDKKEIKINWKLNTHFLKRFLVGIIK